MGRARAQVRFRRHRGAAGGYVLHVQGLRSSGFEGSRHYALQPAVYREKQPSSASLQFPALEATRCASGDLWSAKPRCVDRAS